LQGILQELYERAPRFREKITTDGWDSSGYAAQYPDRLESAYRAYHRKHLHKRLSDHRSNPQSTSTVSPNRLLSLEEFRKTCFPTQADPSVETFVMLAQTLLELGSHAYYTEPLSGRFYHLRKKDLNEALAAFIARRGLIDPHPTKMTLLELWTSP